MEGVAAGNKSECGSSRKVVQVAGFSQRGFDGESLNDTPHFNFF